MQSTKNMAVFSLIAAAVLALEQPQTKVADCNNNAVPDDCEIDCGPSGGVCDVAGCGLGDDCNINGVPDECEID